MLLFLLADDILAGLGQVSAVILCIYMLVFIIIGLGVSAGLMFGLAWVRQKAELVKKLRPVVDSINTTTDAAAHGRLPVAGQGDNKIIRTVAKVPEQLHSVEGKIEAGSDKVAKAVIEFRARTIQVQSVAKAFLLPGLIKPKTPPVYRDSGLEFKSPGYQTLIQQAAPDDSANPAVTASQLKAVGSDGTEQPALTASDQVAEQLTTVQGPEKQQPRDVLLR